MKISKNEKIAGRIIEGQAFVVTTKDSTLHLFNEVGTRIWQLLEEEKNFKKIVEQIYAEYDVDQLTAERDVCEFIRILEKKGILKIV